MIKTVLLDVGGTLVKGPALFEEISEEVEKSYGFGIYEELRKEYRKRYNSSSFQTVKEILNESTREIL